MVEPLSGETLSLVLVPGNFACPAERVANISELFDCVVGLLTFVPCVVPATRLMELMSVLLLTLRQILAK